MGKGRVKENKKKYVLMNKDAYFFGGFIKGKINWTDNLDLAKEFKGENKDILLKRWLPDECIERMYI